MPKLKQIQNKIQKEGLDSFFFSSKANIFYMTYFSSSNAYVILKPDEKYFITDSRYYEGAKEKLKDWNVIELDAGEKKGIDHLRELINQLGGEKVGFEKDKVTISFYEKLLNKNSKEKKDRLHSHLIGYEGFLNEIRMVKTEEEINIIKQAVKKTDNIFKKLLKEIPKSKTELDIRKKIINYIFEEGGTGESFPAIVASGEHSAIPHWETSSSSLKWNTFLLIDMGLIYKGYCSDFTRTIGLGKIDKELEKIYHIVKEAHEEATNVVKAGIPIGEIDLAARRVIEKAGYKEYFIHSTGHGIGVEIHEEPRIYKTNQDLLQENTVFTIEPGVYIPGKAGVRLENIVVCRKDKAQVLTETDLELRILER
ncbi:MAG: aminopeptidase P family protein [Aquificae bacterium]|nr:aminopeptidase P family protein [Aquificota bacterium]